MKSFFFQVTDQSVNQFTVLRVYQDKMTYFVQIVGCYLSSSFQILTVSKKKYCFKYSNKQTGLKKFTRC